jgi:hypothetical protein
LSGRGEAADIVGAKLGVSGDTVGMAKQVLAVPGEDEGLPTSSPSSRTHDSLRRLAGITPSG